MAKTNAERQAAYRARQKEVGRKPHTLLLTEDEAFYVERLILTLRKLGAVPAMVRLPNGTLKPVDL